MRNHSSKTSLQEKQGMNKVSFFDRIRSAVSMKAAAILLALGVTSHQEASANVARCINTSEVTKSVQLLAIEPIETLQKAENTPAILTYRPDIGKEIRETPIARVASLEGKIASIATRKNSALNLRDENGSVIRSIPYGKKIRLSGDRKETVTGNYVYATYGTGKNALEGWVSDTYIEIQVAFAPVAAAVTPAVVESMPAPAIAEEEKKAPKAIAETKTAATAPAAISEPTVRTPSSEAIAPAPAKRKNTTKAQIDITDEDRAKFKEVHETLLRKAAELRLDIPAFKAAIAKNEGSGSYSQTNQALADKLGVDSSQVADGRYQFIPGTRSAVNRAFFKKPQSGLRSLFLKSGEFQEAMMDGLILLNIESLNANSYLSDAVEDGKVSPTFALSAMHYSGIKGAKSAVRAALSGKTLVGKTDWMGKTDIFTYAAVAEDTYNQALATSIAKSNAQKMETATPASTEKTAEKPAGNVLKVSFDTRSSEEAATKKAISTINEKEEAALRSNLSSYIHRTQTEMIAAKAKYRKLGDLGKMQAVTEFILASERRIHDIQDTPSIPKYYKGIISALEQEVRTAKNPAILAKSQNALMIVKKEFSYAVTLVKQISSGEISVEKPAILIRNNTVHALNSTLRKAA